MGVGLGAHGFARCCPFARRFVLILPRFLCFRLQPLSTLVKYGMVIASFLLFLALPCERISKNVSINSLPPLRKRGGRFDLDAVRTDISALEVEQQDPTFWSDADRAKRVSQKLASLRKEFEVWDRLRKNTSDLGELAALAAEDRDADAFAEIDRDLLALERAYNAVEFTMLFSGKHDASDAILAIHAGSGGTEAQDWAEMLLRMYTRYAEQHGFGIELLSESRGQEAGIKSIMLRVSGRYAYGYLRSEAGTHRLVRISPFDADKLRHTSFALVEVIPALEEVSGIEINPNDLRIDTFMSGGKGGQSVNTTYSAVRIVHLPTGITVSCQNERSQTQNKETAMKILKARLLKMQEEEQEREKKRLRGEFKSAEWGSQIRSYVLHPYKLVKDHRTGHETSEAEDVLNGALDPFIEAYLRGQVSGVREELNLDE